VAQKEREEERKIKRLVYHKTRKRNEDEGKVLKHDQKKGRGREKKTERDIKRVSARARIRVCVYTRAGVLVVRCDGVNERGDSPSGRRTGARGPESRRSKHVLLSASRVEKARGNFQVLKRPLITRHRV